MLEIVLSSIPVFWGNFRLLLSSAEGRESVVVVEVRVLEDSLDRGTVLVSACVSCLSLCTATPVGYSVVIIQGAYYTFKPDGYQT